MILTVWSASPMARNLDLCSPSGTVARLRQETSADISRRSVYSLSCPACQDNSVEVIQMKAITIVCTSPEKQPKIKSGFFFQES